jgi:hypothetical protein
VTDEPGFEEMESVHAPGDDFLEDEDVRLAESAHAGRLSPYSIAAFVVSVLSLWMVPQSSFFFLGDPSFRGVFGALGPAGSGVIALWLSGRAEEEIFVAEGALGGVGFCRAARVVALLTLVLIGLGIAAMAVEALKLDV